MGPRLIVPLPQLSLVPFCLNITIVTLVAIIGFFGGVTQASTQPMVGRVDQRFIPQSVAPVDVASADDVSYERLDGPLKADLAPIQDRLNNNLQPLVYLFSPGLPYTTHTTQEDEPATPSKSESKRGVIADEQSKISKPLQGKLTVKVSATTPAVIPPKHVVTVKPVMSTNGLTRVSEKTKPNIMATKTGYASWYGPGFHGRRAANGSVFNMNALTAAHRTLPFGTHVRVVNPINGRACVVTITDRGPYCGTRMIDLSKAAAMAIGMLGAGTAKVSLQILSQQVGY
jgi:rare lipoprotein A